MSVIAPKFRLGYLIKGITDNIFWIIILVTLIAIPVIQIVLIYIDFETFGEHHWPESGIFDFLYHLPREVGKWKNVKWVKISELLRREPVDAIDVKWFISWADTDRDLSAWLGNSMQRAAFEAVKALEPLVRKINTPEVWETWRRLLTSDHFYYMSTKFAGDEEVHSYFRGEVYANPYEAFTNYMNIIQDFKVELEEVAAQV